MPDDRITEDKTQVPTNLRLMRILEVVARAGVPIPATAIAEEVGLPKPTVYRILATAEAEGYLQRDVDGRAYGPGRQLRRLATHTLSSQRVRTERLLIMKALAKDVGETTNLAAPGRYGMVYLDRVETHWPLRIQFPIGTQVPFHITASGKMYLSTLRKDKLERLLTHLDLAPYTAQSITDPADLVRELSLIRDRGYSTDEEEFLDGMCAVAVPILDDQNRFLTTLTIQAPTQRVSLAELEMWVPRLREAATGLQDLVRDDNDGPTL